MSFDYSAAQKTEAEQRAKAQIDVTVRSTSDEQLVAQRKGGKVHEYTDFSQGRTEMRNQLTMDWQQKRDQYDAEIKSMRSSVHVSNHHDALRHRANADVMSAEVYPGMVAQDRMTAARQFQQTGNGEGYANALSADLKNNRSASVQTDRSTAASVNPQSIDARFDSARAMSPQHSDKSKAVNNHLVGQGEQAGLVADSRHPDPARRGSAQEAMRVHGQYRDAAQETAQFHKDHGIDRPSQIMNLQTKDREKGQELFAKTVEQREQFLKTAQTHQSVHQPLNRVTDREPIKQDNAIRIGVENHDRMRTASMEHGNIKRGDGSTLSMSEHRAQQNQIAGRSHSQGQSHSASHAAHR
jgi:hypothetical protein